MAYLCVAAAAGYDAIRCSCLREERDWDGGMASVGSRRSRAELRCRGGLRCDPV